MTTTEPRAGGAATAPQESGLGALLATAALLVLAALVIGTSSNGTDAGRVGVLIVLLATAVFGRAAWRGSLPRSLKSAPALLLMALLTALSALSVSWSLLPAASLTDALRLTSYTAALATVALIAQTKQQRAQSFALGVGVAALVISLYALLSRGLPGLFDSELDDFARLRLPFGYWNAVGALAAVGVVIALWAGVRRRGSAAVEIASYPAAGLMVAALMLSQSRGALLALLITLVCWLLIVPRRLRSAGWLLALTACSALFLAWAYSRTGLTTDHLPLAERKSIGWKLLVALLLLSLALTLCGALIRRRRLQRALPSAERQKAGRMLLAAAGLGIIALLAVGIQQQRFDDLSGQFFSTSATAAPSNSPERLTQTSSLRGRYWSESWTILKAHPWQGTGADTFAVARLPYRPDQLNAAHAHGMVPQVAADLGLPGVVIVLGLALAWLLAALRVVGASFSTPWRWLTDADETALATVAVSAAALLFGIHSAIDWVWFMPGVALFGIACGGWTLGSPGPDAGGRAADATPVLAGSARTRGLRSGLIIVVGLLIAQGVWQPTRAAQKVDDGFAVVDSAPQQAQVLARSALRIDPTSDRAQMLLASAQSNAGQERAAEHTLERLALTQPNNPSAWRRLAQFRLTVLGDPDGAVTALRPAFWIDPLDPSSTSLLLAARQTKADELIERLGERRRDELEEQLRELDQIQSQIR